MVRVMVRFRVRVRVRVRVRDRVRVMPLLTTERFFYSSLNMFLIW